MTSGWVWLLANFFHKNNQMIIRMIIEFEIYGLLLTRYQAKKEMKAVKLLTSKYWVIGAMARTTIKNSLLKSEV